MQRLLQDTKEIRSEYVVGLGSATYGSLVRRLLGGPGSGPTLLLGAGQLAETVLPYLECGRGAGLEPQRRPRTRAGRENSERGTGSPRLTVHRLLARVGTGRLATRA